MDVLFWEPCRIGSSGEQTLRNALPVITEAAATLKPR
jgi:hypothetical protein